MSVFVKNFKYYLYLIIILCVFFACGGGKQEFVDTVYNNETIPSMASDSVTELISDSGYVRYKLITKTWLFFENAQDPHWLFPDGFYGEQFDTLFNVQITLKADTVWNFTQRKVWRLKGNVIVKNIKNETFKSDELYWDEKIGRIYSDKYIEIDRPDQMLLKGYGLESNQTMTNYKIMKPFDSDFYVKDEPESEGPVIY